VPPLACKTAEIIPGYTIRNRIGAGGYGEVWNADAPGGLAKAIKIVYGCLEGERASRELKALTRIKEVRHPFLLSLERIEVVDGQLVIVSELADANLMNRFEQCVAAGAPGIPRDELLVYLSDAADALDYMQAAFSLQHLDIKPENLLILGGRVKVADFGLVKDIQDPAVSMVGGWTPVYAAPEVVTGHPSLRSDQYSLAIVFQELLTGILPFSGRKAAQLVMQHQRSSPRLEPLPPDDRPVITRALAKNPDDRFPSCRELIDQLRNSARSSKPAGRANISSATPNGRRGDTSAAKSSDTAYHGQKCKKQTPWPAAGSNPAAPSDATMLFDGDALSPSSVIGRLTSGIAWSEGEPGLSNRDDWPFLSTGPAESCGDLPPLQTDPAAWHLRPCLVLGLGGPAALVLNGLRSRWSNRFGDLADMPALQMLLVDNDRRSLAAAMRGESSRALKASETIAMPLRAPDAYYEESEKYLKWLRRRWLTLIPRSLCTEGLRPLGRLALVDHLPELIGRLKTAISAMVSADANAASSRRLGREVPPSPPQIVLLASISGGTGSGMLLDAAYAVRKVLDDLFISDASLTSVLLHWTGPDANGKLLARANACSCLRELRTFGRGQGYPGDADFGMPDFDPDIPPFDTTRVVHLGDGLGQEEFGRAAETVAQFLDLATASAAGAFFASGQEPQTPEMTVRTFGLSRIGRTQTEFVTNAVDLLCRKTAVRWLRESCGDAAARQPGPDDLLAQLSERIELQIQTDSMTESLLEELGSVVEQLTDAKLAGEGGVLAARASLRAALGGMREFITELDNRQRELDLGLVQLKTKAAASRNWFALFGSRRRPTSRTWRDLDSTALRSLATMLRSLQDRIAAVLERIDKLYVELEDLIADFADSADGDVAVFLEGADPDLVQQLDQELRKEYLGGPGETPVLIDRRGATRDDLRERLRQAGRAYVLDALRRGDFRVLLPAAQGEPQLEPQLLKACLENAAPRLTECGGSRRLWFVGASDHVSALVQKSLEDQSTQPPAAAVDASSDFVIGWEVEGMSLSRVAANVIDNQREVARLASLLHTRQDIDW
jgi:serine/threonine protein kinase